MNDFTAIGLAFTALFEPNTQICVVTSNTEVHRTVELLTKSGELTPPDLMVDVLRPSRASFVNGDEKVEYSNGSRIRINRFQSRDRLRGASTANILFIDPSVSETLRTYGRGRDYDDLHADLRAMLVSCPQLKVVYG